MSAILPWTTEEPANNSWNKGPLCNSYYLRSRCRSSSFQDVPHLVSWCGLKPRYEESAGEIKAHSVTHGNKFLRKTLIDCSWAASKTQGCFFSKFSYYQTVVRKKNKLKVTVAVAKKILTAVWFVIHNNVVYWDYVPDIVRSLTLWWSVPACKLANALCGLGCQFELLSSKRAVFYIFNTPILISGVDLLCRPTL